MAQHALLSPSGFDALMVCSGKPAMEMGSPSKPNEYTDHGTAAHFLLDHCLSNGALPAAFRGREIAVGSTGDWDGAAWADGENDPSFEVRHAFPVDAEMIDAINRVIDNVYAVMEAHRKAGATVQIHSETRVPIGHITGEEGAEGTADVIIVAAYPDGRYVIEVHDLKYGKGVEVSPVENPQCLLYGLGAIEHLALALVADQIDVVLVIHQPRIKDEPQVWETTHDWMRNWVEQHAKPAAQRAWAAVDFRKKWGETHIKYLKADADACRFCGAKADCPEFDRFTRDALEAEFTDLTTQDAEGQRELVEGMIARIPESGVGARMDAVEVVEMWCKAVRARAESLLLNGRPVAGYKLVKGKAPAREWDDETAAEKEMKAMRLKRDEMYSLKLISPTQAEKLLKSTPKRWARVEKMVTRGEGKPSVARADDKREALEIAPIESEFEAIVVDETLNAAEDLV